MNWKKAVLGIVIFIAVERFCYFQTGTFSLSKMVHEAAPPSPASTNSPIELQQPLRFLGAGKQFFAFETEDGEYVVKFMKWSRRRPLIPQGSYLEKWVKRTPLQKYMDGRKKLATNLQNSCLLALQTLPHESQLITARPVQQFTLIDKLGIIHTVPSRVTHYYVQRKASSFTDHLEKHPAEAASLLRSYIHTVATQCRHGVANLDPVVDRNYGVVDGHVILLDIGSLLASPKLYHGAAIQHEIVLELLPLRAHLQKHHPEHLPLFDTLLRSELSD